MRRENDGHVQCWKEVMRPRLLTFYDAALEHAFEKHCLLTSQRAADLSFLAITTLVYSVLAFKCLFEQRLAVLRSLPYFLVIFYVIASWIVYLHSSLDTLLRIRPMMAAIFRISAAVVEAVTSYYVKWMFQLDSSFLFSILQILLATETFGNLPFAFNMRVKFQYHLIIQTVAYSILIVWRAPQLCAKFMVSPGATNLAAIDASFDSVLEIVFCTFYSSTGDCYLPPSIPKLPCFQLTVFLMSYFSMGIVSYVLWASEKKSRIKFLKANGISIKDVHSGNFVWDVIFLLFSASFYWHYSAIGVNFFFESYTKNTC